MFHSGDQIGPYTLVNRLGGGAFGIVWLAERRTQIATTRVAIKIPLDDDVDLEVIRREASLWVKASGHPNVLPIIEADVYDGQVVIVSEYAPDGSLAGWLTRNGGKAPSIKIAIDMELGILAGLEHLHSQYIIHRDLKPPNLLLQGQIPRLADFGISRVLKSTSHSSKAVGTPAYMAPEAFDAKRNEQTDIWSAGVILYQMLSGTPPFPQTDMASLIAAILNREPAPLPNFIPKALREIVYRSLMKDVTRRYSSATEMRIDIQKTLQISDQTFQETTVLKHIEKEAILELPPESTIIHALKIFSPQPSLFVTPEIPEHKLTNARAYTAVPITEQILGLVDCTLSGGVMPGTAKAAVVFTNKGCYFRGSGVTGKLPYTEFPQCEFRVKGLGFLRKIEAKRDLVISFNGSGLDVNIALAILKSIRDVMAEINK